MRSLFLAVLFLASCSGAGSGGGGDDSIIDKPGTYVFAEHNLKLTVSEQKTALISVDITDTLGNALTTDTFPDFSRVHEWGVYVDSAANVWVISSDLGNYRLSKVDGAYAVSVFIINKHNQHLFPQALRGRLPSSLNNRLNR